MFVDVRVEGAVCSTLHKKNFGKPIMWSSDGAAKPPVKGHISRSRFKLYGYAIVALLKADQARRERRGERKARPASF